MKAPANQDDRIWRALSDQVRRKMLDALSEAPKTTGALVEAFEPLCRTAVMKHLDVLVAAGLVVVRRDGRLRWNHLNPVPIDRICRRWLDAHRVRMSAALHRLKRVAEATLDDRVDSVMEKTGNEEHNDARRARGRVRVRD